jgi:hypothetical protein
MLSRDDPFYSSKYSIERGKQHAANLAKGVKAFVATKPYTLVREPDPDTGGKVEKIRVTKPFPDDLEGIALDAAANLRNALDQAMFSVMRKDTNFPFGKSSNDFERAVERYCKKVPEDIINLIRGFKPYVGGDGVLWALNKFGNTTKHATIVPMCAAVGSMSLGSYRINNVGKAPFTLSMPRWDFAKNEMVICRFGGNTGVAYDSSNFRISLFITVHGIPVIEGQPVESVLAYLIGKVGEIVMAIEAEAIRLKSV